MRLGHGVYLSGRLEASAMDGAVEALTRFRRSMDELGIEHYRAVATSAVRESSNKDAFIARVLDESERVRVTRLASLLRVADALDREHVQRVTDLTAKLSDDELTLWLDGTAGLLMEGWSLKKKANLFHKIFGRKVKLRFLGEEQAVAE